MSRPTPRKTLSLGGNDRMLINLILDKFPPSAFAQVSIGDPRVDQRLHIDTGSDLTWVLHDPLSGYDPSNSFSFRYRSCLGFRSGIVTPSKIRGQCNYNPRYADGSSSPVTLGNEVLTFSTGDGGSGGLKNVLFGFGNTLGGPQVGTGALGLSLGDFSILKKFGGKFSICIGNFNDIQGGENYLAIGDDAVFVGMKVSLDITDTSYKVNLTSIIVDGETLAIQNTLSKTKSILDTGTSVLALVPEVYNVVVRKIVKRMADEGYNLYEDRSLFCHPGKIPEHVKILVRLKFGKVQLDMPTTKLFVQTEDHGFCLSVRESWINANLIGIPVFQGLNMGFDVPHRKLYIKYVRCNELYDRYKDELDLLNP